MVIGVVMIIAAVSGQAMEEDSDAWFALRRIEPFGTIIRWIWPSAPTPTSSGCVMGKR
jgi:hypothetical protein